MFDGIRYFLDIGGPVVWILLIVSIASVSVILLKLWQFYSLRPERNDAIEESLEHWRQGSHEEALVSLESSQFGSEILVVAMNRLQDGDISLDLLRDELDRLAMSRLQLLRSLLPALEAIGTLSPLLGLLGTVIGMIAAFQALELAGSNVDPAILSGGIWQALLTTALGLSIAIPVVSVHNWMERKVQRVAAMLDDAVTRVFSYYYIEK